MSPPPTSLSPLLSPTSSLQQCLLPTSQQRLQSKPLARYSQSCRGQSNPTTEACTCLFRRWKGYVIAFSVRVLSHLSDDSNYFPKLMILLIMLCLVI